MIEAKTKHGLFSSQAIVERKEMRQILNDCRF